MERNTQLSINEVFYACAEPATFPLINRDVPGSVAVIQH